jgi:hypothetical protein
MKLLPVFKGSLGLHTKVDPIRLRYDPETGLQHLAVSVNIDTGPEGRVSRRKGYVRRLAGAEVHSLFPFMDYMLCVEGSALNVVEADFTKTTLRDVTPGRRMSYQAIGERVYFSNGFENGYVLGAQSYPWEDSDYVGPETTRSFISPPPGHLIKAFNGRMYIAQTVPGAAGEAHNVLWHTERFAYHRVDPARNFILFEDSITVLESLPDSLVVGTRSGVYALIGAGPEDFDLRKVSEAPAVLGAWAKVRADTLGGGELKGAMVLVVTHDGVCLVGQGGFFDNLTIRKMDMPHFSEGCASIVNGKLVACLYK